MTNDIEKYAKGLLANSQKHLKRSLDESGADALHKLRVEIKKIYALHHFLSYCYTDKFGKNKKLKKLFRRAGKIRDLQLLILHLEKQIKVKTKDERKLLAKLKRQLGDRSKLFKQHYRHNTTVAFEKTISAIQKCLLVKPKKEPDAYFGIMKGKITLSVNNLGLDEKRIHTLRKDIKTLKYNLKMSKKIKSVNLMDEKLLTKWDGLIGDWHDAVQLATRIEKIKTKLKPQADLQHKLMLIRRDCINRSKGILQEFSRTPIVQMG